MEKKSVSDRGANLCFLLKYGMFAAVGLRIKIRLLST